MGSREWDGNMAKEGDSFPDRHVRGRMKLFGRRKGRVEGGFIGSFCLCFLLFCFVLMTFFSLCLFDHVLVGRWEESASWGRGSGVLNSYCKLSIKSSYQLLMQQMEAKVELSCGRSSGFKANQGQTKGKPRANERQTIPSGGTHLPPAIARPFPPVALAPPRASL